MLLLNINSASTYTNNCTELIVLTIVHERYVDMVKKSLGMGGICLGNALVCFVLLCTMFCCVLLCTIVHHCALLCTIVYYCVLCTSLL